jgi:predicted RecA/RadA family phage recombinase
MLNPVPTTAYNARRFRAADGTSVVVTVPESSEISVGDIVKIDGFIGFAMSSVTTAAGETASLTVRIWPDIYETDQITTTEDFDIGDLVYWNDTTKKLTTTATDMIGPVAKVVTAKDANNVVEVLWLHQV